MITALLALSILGNLFALIFVLGAHAAAKDSVIDTMRLDAITEHNFHLTSYDGAWGVVHDNKMVAEATDLRAAIDAADNKVGDHG